jgi:hypothetical protein
LKRLLPFVFLILLVLVGIVSIPYLLQPERHRQEITTTLTTLLKMPVAIGPMSMGYLPPTLRLEQVAVMNGTGNPLLQVGSVVAPLDWAALFHLKFAAQEVELSHWRLDIQRKADGGWDIEDWMPQTSGLSDAKAWTLRRIHWKEGEVHWVDRFAASPQELVLASVAGQWDPRPETLDAQGTFASIVAGTSVSFTAKGQFFSSPQWSGDLTFSDQGNTAAFQVIRSHVGGISASVSQLMDIKGQAARWRLSNALSFLRFYGRSSAASMDSASALMLESWQVHANVHDADVTFDHSAGISGGLSEAKGSVVKGANGAVVHAELAAKDVPAAALFDALGEKIPLDGKVTMVVKGFEAVLSSAAAGTLAGEGSIELKDGSYILPDSAVKRLAKAKTMAYFKQKFPDFAQKGIPITKLSAHWKAKNGIASVDDGRLVSTDIKAAWVGKLDLAREGLDGTLRLQIHEKDPKKLRLIPEKYQGAPAYGRLQGTWGEWSLKASPESKISAAVRSKLSKAIQAK